MCETMIYPDLLHTFLFCMLKILSNWTFSTKKLPSVDEQTQLFQCVYIRGLKHFFPSLSFSILCAWHSVLFKFQFNKGNLYIYSRVGTSTISWYLEYHQYGVFFFPYIIDKWIHIIRCCKNNNAAVFMGSFQCLHQDLFFIVCYCSAHMFLRTV